MSARSSGHGEPHVPGGPELAYGSGAAPVASGAAGAEPGARPPRAGRARRLVRDVLALLALLAVLELGVRAFYAVRWPERELELVPVAWEGGQMGLEREAAGDAIPPWERRHQLTRYGDPELFWTLAPSKRRRFRFGGRTVDLFTNSEGFHTPEFFHAKGEGVFRVVCLGSSFTFLGWPQELESLLRWTYPEARFEVVNLAVPGYSSHQLRALARRLAPELEYDVALCAVGGNEFLNASVADSERAGATRVRRLFERLELFRLAAWAARSAFGPAGAAEPDEADLVPRVSPQEMGANLRAVAAALRPGAGEPVLFLEMNPLPGNYQARLGKIVHETDSALVDVTTGVAELLGLLGLREHYVSHPDALGDKAVAAIVYRELTLLPGFRAHLGGTEPVALDALWPPGSGGRYR